MTKSRGCSVSRAYSTVTLSCLVCNDSRKVSHWEDQVAKIGHDSAGQSSGSGAMRAQFLSHAMANSWGRTRCGPWGPPTAQGF